MKGHKGIHMVTFLLLVIGGLNWLLIGLFNYDVVYLLGATVAKVVYVLVGVSAVYELAMHKTNCRLCGMQTSSGQ